MATFASGDSGDQAMAEKSIPELYRDIATAIVGEMPAGEWRRAVIEARLLSTVIELEATYFDANGQPVSVYAGDGADFAFEAIRNQMGDANGPRGAWYSARFELSADGKYDVRYDYDSKPAFSTEPTRDMLLEDLKRTDPDTAQSTELPTLKLSSSTIFDFSVSADGEYVALVSAASQGPGTRTSVVSTLDGELVNAFDLPGGLLTWAPSGHVFAFEGGGRPQVYARPEDHAPIWSLSDAGCAALVWRPAHTLSTASSAVP